MSAAAVLGSKPNCTSALATRWCAPWARARRAADGAGPVRPWQRERPGMAVHDRPRRRQRHPHLPAA